MFTLAPYIIIALVGITTAARWSHKTYYAPRLMLLALGAGFMLVLSALYGANVYINRNVLVVLVGLIGYWFIRDLISDHIEIALEEFVMVVSAIIICIFIEPGREVLGFSLLIISALINSIVAISQYKFKHEPFKNNSNKIYLYPIGLIGNTNMLGVWLVPHIFLSIWLTSNHSPFWLITTAILTYTMVITSCRSAYIGFAGGVAYLVFSVFGLLYFVGLVIITAIVSFILWKYDVRITEKTTFRELFTRSSTFRERRNYWKVAIKGLYEYWIFGLGFNIFKSHIPFVQRKLNQETKGEFLKPENYECPYPQRTHCDYMQFALDFGIPAAMIFIGMIILSLIGSKDVFLNTAMIGLLVSGLTFHSFYIAPITIIYLMLVLHMARSVEVVYIFDNIPIAILILSLILIVAFRRIMYDQCFHRFTLTQNPEWLYRALYWFSRSGEAHTFAGTYWTKHGDISKSLAHNTKSITTYDGDQRIWECFTNLAISYMLSGAPKLALAACEEALSFLPTHEPAKNIIALSNHMIENPGKKFIIGIE